MPREPDDTDDVGHLAAQAGLDVVEDDRAWDFFALAARSGVSVDEVRRQFVENARRRFPDQVVGES